MPGESSNSEVSPRCSTVASESAEAAADGPALEGASRAQFQAVLDALTAARDGWLVTRDPAVLLAKLGDVLRRLSETA